MKFGKTKEQVKEERLAHLTKMFNGGEERFAWKPITLSDGRKVWLEKYKATWKLKSGLGEAAIEHIIRDLVSNPEDATYPFYSKQIIVTYEAIN